MREKLNDNPTVQIVTVLLLLVGAFVVFTQLGGGGESEEAAPTEATVAVAGSGATGTATGATPGEAVEGAVTSALESSATTAAPVSPADIPAPPLPGPVEAAYQDGKTVTLLLVHDGGIDDRLVASSTRQLESFPDTAVFIVPAKQIARYGAITLGLDVQQVPALVVVRPKHLSKGGPEASILYGFQTRQGIAQTVRDASYHGPERNYYPE